MGNKAIKSDQFWPFLYRKRWNWAGRSRWMSFGLGALWSKQNCIEKVLKWRNCAQKSYRPLKFIKIWKKIKIPMSKAECELRTSANLIMSVTPQSSRPPYHLTITVQKFEDNQSLQSLYFFHLYFPPPHLASNILLCTIVCQLLICFEEEA